MKKEVGRNVGNDKVKVSHRFVNALSIVSILGFAGIVSYTIFDFDLNFYVEALLMMTIGVGLILEARMKKLRSLSRGITSNNITHLTTIIVGFVAIVAGIFSFPDIRVDNPSFLAIKGIVSLIAVAVIIVQTWVIK
jgi:cell division protein FtsW (lipid II flippase)